MTHGFAQRPARQQPFNRIETFIDGIRVKQRATESAEQQAAATGRHASIEHGNQTAFALTLLCTVDFERTARRRVYAHVVLRNDARRRFQRRALAGLGQVDIGGEQAKR